MYGFLRLSLQMCRERFFYTEQIYRYSWLPAMNIPGGWSANLNTAGPGQAMPVYLLKKEIQFPGMRLFFAKDYVYNSNQI